MPYKYYLNRILDLDKSHNIIVFIGYARDASRCIHGIRYGVQSDSQQDRGRTYNSKDTFSVGIQIAENNKL